MKEPLAAVPLGVELWRFSAVGAMGFAVDAGVFVALGDFAGWAITPARALSTMCAIAATWWLNRHMTFSHRRSQPWAAELLRYGIAQVAGLCINVGIFALALWQLPPLRDVPVVALALGSGVALAFNFTSARQFAFRGRR